MGGLFRDHFHRGSDAAFGDSITHGFQFIVAALLHGIFALEMDNIRALFRLFMTMSAHFDQGFDHPFKCINLIVPNDKATGFFEIRQGIGILKGFC